MKTFTNIFTGVWLSLLLAAFAASAGASGPKGQNLVEKAIEINQASGEFSTLIAAVQAADPAVLQTLTGNGQHTVFAPTDAAFALLGLNAGNVGDLPTAALTDILLYHVAKGRRYAADVLASEKIRTLYGDFLQQAGGVLTDNLGRQASIVITDVEAANGIIHAIDAVVLPYDPNG